MSENQLDRFKFKEGDILRHKVSGEKFIVINLWSELGKYVYILNSGQIGFEMMHGKFIEVKIGTKEAEIVFELLKQ